ncbi:amidohydrolase family protein [Candidatus Latescibacterota bacterium]
MNSDSKSLLISGGMVLRENGLLTRTDIFIEKGAIVNIGEGFEADSVINAEGLTVVPGLIDIHTHGIQRVSVDDGTLEEYARIESSRGTTTFFPTFFAPPETIAARMQEYLHETHDLKTTPQVGGFRLESPYLAQTGAGVSKDLVPISNDITQMLLDAGEGHVKLWDVSPELPDSPEFISAMTEKGIVCSLAHTLATIEQAKESIDAGARLVTHLFDTFEQPVVTDPDQGVYPAGLTDYLLTEDRVVCEIIGDGTHVHPLLVEITFRCKQQGKIAFVTDSNYGAGLPAGHYVLPGSWGNIEIKTSNDGLRMLDRNMELAASALSPIDSFRNAVNLFNKDIAVASSVCSKTPARLLGLNKGEISEGKDADILIIDPEFGVRYTIVGGDTVYRKE